MQGNLFQTTGNLLPFDGDVRYYPDFFSKAESDLFLERLKADIPWKQEPIRIFGREIMQPRLTAWYGDSDKVYHYSGIVMKIHPWASCLPEIKSRVEKLTQTVFTGVLLNYYRSGSDSMGWHRDNEKELGINPLIASVSFGITRLFQFRYYTDKKTKLDITLTHGSLLIMQGPTNHFWEHQLPKSKKATGERINLTFRTII